MSVCQKHIHSFQKHDACTLCWTTWFCNYSQHGHSHPCFFCQKPDFGHWQFAMKAKCVSCGTMAISFPTASWFTAQSSCHSIIGRHDQNFHKGGNPIQGGKASDDPRWPSHPGNKMLLLTNLSIHWFHIGGARRPTMMMQSIWLGPQCLPTRSKFQC